MKTLFILGMPLDETQLPSPQAQKLLSQADVIIGETRKAGGKYLRSVRPDRDKVFFLSPSNPGEEEAMTKAIQQAAESEGSVALFSDTGMPLLFDPGKAILEYCQQLGFAIRSLPAATSWGAATALSGWATPFHLEGFLPREDLPRKKRLDDLKHFKSHCILLDTPYRYHKLVSQLIECYGKERAAFLAWNIGCSDERLLWGALGELEKGTRSLQKGEFVFILKGQL